MATFDWLFPALAQTGEVHATISRDNPAGPIVHVLIGGSETSLPAAVYEPEFTDIIEQANSKTSHVVCQAARPWWTFLGLFK
jgi:hypothetical protein